jgi:hypothetical protein
MPSRHGINLVFVDFFLVGTGREFIFIKIMFTPQPAPATTNSRDGTECRRAGALN